MVKCAQKLHRDTNLSCLLCHHAFSCRFTLFVIKGLQYAGVMQPNEHLLLRPVFQNKRFALQLQSVLCRVALRITPISKVLLKSLFQFNWYSLNQQACGLGCEIFQHCPMSTVKSLQNVFCLQEYNMFKRFHSETHKHSRRFHNTRSCLRYNLIITRVITRNFLLTIFVCTSCHLIIQLLSCVP